MRIILSSLLLLSTGLPAFNALAHGASIAQRRVPDQELLATYEKSGLCFNYLNNCCSEKSLQPCSVFCGEKGLESNGCLGNGIARENLGPAHIFQDDDGNDYTLGQCHCNSSIINPAVEKAPRKFDLFKIFKPDTPSTKKKNDKTKDKNPTDDKDSKDKKKKKNPKEDDKEDKKKKNPKKDDKEDKEKKEKNPKEDDKDKKKNPKKDDEDKKKKKKKKPKKDQCDWKPKKKPSPKNPKNPKSPKSKRGKSAPHGKGQNLSPQQYRQNGQKALNHLEKAIKDNKADVNSAKNWINEYGISGPLSTTPSFHPSFKSAMGVGSEPECDSYYIRNKGDDKPPGGVVIYHTSFSRQAGLIVVHEKFRDRDEKKNDPDRMKWSEVTWQNWKEVAKGDVGRLKAVVEQNIINTGTKDKIELAKKQTCQEGTIAEFHPDKKNTNMDDAFEMLSGTDNVKGVIYMLADHHKELGGKKVTKIVARGNLDLLIVIGK
ncbi:hypothetical protein AJ79_09991 [Helicocarpus griseus UAMH5409]|uniref:Uncharacterized protein n=1 Tax=Helicocarpus griseus UAMH5409 TaxID=1447875 RepID=A0A2B7WG40_9EURO|nr:hypothetical protein AJ79_09991 [Helicocarpus griseus UAMH5409]